MGYAEVVPTRKKVYGSWLVLLQTFTVISALLVLTWTAIFVARQGTGTRYPNNRFVSEVVDPGVALPLEGAPSAQVRLLDGTFTGGWPYANNVLRLFASSFGVFIVALQMYLAVFLNKPKYFMLMTVLFVLTAIFSGVSWILDATIITSVNEECDAEVCTLGIPDELVGDSFICACQLEVYTYTTLALNVLFFVSACTVSVYLLVVSLRGSAKPKEV
ncbi:hypothetical protein NDN08_003196 [Rhodosorus marinus]|uniref:MARVEL domain-containing protein n=1 Tax=Rhodosorus marinus TaxID=101924 RepID=A0AAV8UZG4_9RHOD|nr:hypothetical protein NDN08_003196 [Rhodosorus marinus]